MNFGPVLAVPAREKGRGGGHLARCMALVRDLRAMGREGLLFLPPDTGVMDGLFKTMSFDRSWRITENELNSRRWDCIVLDRFQTPEEEFTRWAGMAGLVGIDEGGPCRNRFDFLIDILPALSGRSSPNIADPSLLPLPEKKLPQRPPSGKIKVLVSFGQEDTAGLGPASAKALAAANGSGILDITLLAGVLKQRQETPPPEGVNVSAAIPGLSERLGGYDLVITHYGITAFEALYAGTRVILVSPGGYHEKLAKTAGFCSAGIGPRGAVKLSRLLFSGGGLDRAFLQSLQERCAALTVKYHLEGRPQQSLAAIIGGIGPLPVKKCPVCGSAGLAVVNRQKDRSFWRCPACGLVSMSRLSPPPIEYGREYFFEQYQKQYGKTYIEDFPNLTAMAKRRLAVIKGLLQKNTAGKTSQQPSLLDIGCAYGPFLAAADAEGFSPFGMDPAQDAVSYVRQTLDIPAMRGFFPDAAVPGNYIPFDVVSLWYVIEHFQDCVPVFAEIRRILKPGGILAFATPSVSGVSGRSSLKRFLEQSPADHWTVWSPVMCKKALAATGFRVKKIIVGGHHPERFPFLGKFAQNKTGPLYALLMALSKLFALGDTFEVYAEYESKE